MLEKVKVPRMVFRALEMVRKQGKVSMYDINHVIEELERAGYKIASGWVLNNHGLYLTGVLRGFESEE